MSGALVFTFTDMTDTGDGRGPIPFGRLSVGGGPFVFNGHRIDGATETLARDYARESKLTLVIDDPCGLGKCAARRGHVGTCDEASGWDEEWRAE